MKIKINKKSKVTHSLNVKGKICFAAMLEEALISVVELHNAVSIAGNVKSL